MYNINFSNKGNTQVKNYQKYGQIGSIMRELHSNWKMLDMQQGSAFAGPMKVYFHHPERSCVSIYTEDNPPYIDFFSINKETLKQTLEELALDFEEENILEF